MRSSSFKTNVLFCILTLLILHAQCIIINTQPNDEWEIIEKESEIEIARIEAGLEKFRISIHKNGGIISIEINKIPYTNISGSSIRDASGQIFEQTWYSSPIANPVIEKKDDYVEARFYGKYDNAEVYVETNYTISKNGLILILNILRTNVDVDLRNTHWRLYFPRSVFQGEKVYAKVQDRIEEAVLTREVTTGDMIYSYDVIYWVDFSKKSEGVTFINMAPGSDMWYFAAVSDELQWGNYDVYSMRLAHKADGAGAMYSGEKRPSRVAIYLHGPGGYRQYEDFINLVSSLASLHIECEKIISNSGGTDAGKLAVQAMEKADSALEKLLRADDAGARTDFENAKSLVQKTKETGGGLSENLIAVLIVTVILIAILIAILRKRRKIALKK
ncbi:MAG: hypothetical protein ACUVQ0_04615 [Thermoproteota archaeon]